MRTLIMKTNKKPLPDNPEQSQRFVETAKVLGSDESGKAFDRAIKVVVKPKSSVAKPKQRPR